MPEEFFLAIGVARGGEFLRGGDTRGGSVRDVDGVRGGVLGVCDELGVVDAAEEVTDEEVSAGEGANAVFV